MSRRIPPSLWVLLGTAGVLGAALLLGHRVSTRVVEVGVLDPVQALPAERLEVVHLQRGQTFGSVLQSASVGWSEQNALLLAFREQANPRRMQDGTRITLRYLPEEGSLRGVDVTMTRDETVRLTRDEVGWSVDLVRTPVWTDTLLVSGVIRDILWNAVLANAALSELPSPDRASVVTWMDQIFQWQVDFSRQVQTGDTYRFVLEREVRPDGSMKSGRLLAAEYLNRGTPYRAIWFDPQNDGQGTYYDEDGKSVRRAFLLKPIELARISSGFSAGRLHPVHNIVRPHRGVDFAAPTGTPIMATGDGVVAFAGWRGELGNLVEIRHPNGWLTRYGHMSRFAAGVRTGTRVRQGQIIGYVGMTGVATGPHCHYEMVRPGGQWVDPLSIPLPPGDPVPASAVGRWALESQSRLELLETLPGPPILKAPSRVDLVAVEDQPDNGGQ
jgi:murein DD-endopeptidase MepM/ murein hydrolase activator NlpD